MFDPTISPIPATASVVTVTPAIAADWLENRNLGNRALSRAIAERYARTMADGRWLLTHQGVAFDRDGFLLDGQHRLRAVIVAGVPVDMWVMPGLDRATFAILDTGHKRRAAQVMRTKGATAIASAARIVGVISGEIVSDKVLSGIYAQQLDNDQVLAIVEAWPELSERHADAFACFRAARVQETPHLAVLAMASRTSHKDRIADWVEGVRDGAGLDASDPRLHLRNRFIGQSRPASSNEGRVHSYRLIVRAWNAYALGRPMGLLRIRDDEPTPDIAP